MNYYINGWKEKKNYFCQFGFTFKEMERMMNGEIIEKEGNRFWIEKEEEQ